MNIIVGKKVNMTQYFDEATGSVIPVTVVKAGANVVTQVKTKEGKDGYNAVQVGAGKTKNLSKPLRGHLKDLGSFSVLTVFKVKDMAGMEKGKKLDLSTFEVGEIVNVEGTSKGRGFTGTVKRHHFGGMPKTHGHNKPRAVGSIGQRWPQHVRKGLRMAGHMGNAAITVKNLQVVHVDAAKNLISLKGAIPGHRNAFVKITSTGRVKPLVKIEEIKEVKKK
jgi:large subunit ribosomal protein L3